MVFSYIIAIPTNARQLINVSCFSSASFVLGSIYPLLHLRVFYLHSLSRFTNDNRNIA